MSIEVFGQRYAKVRRVGEEMYQSLASRTAGKPGGAASMEIYSSLNHSTKSYTRNPNCWLADLIGQFTGCTIYKNSLGCMESYGGVAITKRHLLGCQHAHPWSSQTWGGNPSLVIDAETRFVTENNVTVLRQQIGQGEYPVGSPQSVDLSVWLLDEDLPDSIHILPILETPPSTFYTYYSIGGFGQWAHSQGYGRDPNQATPTPLSSYPPKNKSMLYVAFPYNHTGFRYQVYGGDSGTPYGTIYKDTVYLGGIISGAPMTPINVQKVIDLISVCDADAVARGKITAPTNYLPTVVKFRELTSR